MIDNREEGLELRRENEALHLKIALLEEQLAKQKRESARLAGADVAFLLSDHESQPDLALGSSAQVDNKDEILQAIGEAAEVFLGAIHWRECIVQVLEKMGRATQTSRVYMFQNNHHQVGELTCTQLVEWNATGVEPQENNPNIHDSPYFSGGMGRWARMLGSNQVLSGIVKDFPESEQEILVPQGILSLVVVPIFVERKWWGFVGLDDCQRERCWTHAEKEALRAMAGLIGAAISRERAEEAYRILVEYSQQEILIYQAGQIIYANPAACRNSGYSADELKFLAQEEILQIIHVEDQERVRGLQYACLSDGIVSDRCELRTYTKGGEIRWLEVISVKCEHYGQKAYQITCLDVTNRKQAEIALNQLNRELEQRVLDRTAALRDANKALADSVADYQSIQEELRSQQSFLRQVIDIIPDMVFVRDKEGRFILANRAIANYYGVEVEEMEGARHIDLTGGETRLWRLFCEEDRQTLEKGCALEIPEQKFVDLNGEEIWQRVVKIPLVNDSGDERILGVITDITVLKKAEEAIREGERLFRLMVENTPQGLSIEQNDTIVYANQALADLLGYELAEIMKQGKGKLDFVHSLDRQYFKHRQAKFASESKVWLSVYRVKRKDGSFRLVEDYSTGVSYQGKPARLSLVMDITERKRLEDAYRVLLDNSIQGVFVFQDGEMKFANQAMAEISGYSVVELVTMRENPMDILLYPTDAEKLNNWVTSQEYVDELFEVCLRCKDGSECWIEGYLVHIEFQEKPALQGFVRDITTRKLAVEKIENLARFPDENPNPVLRVDKDGLILYANKQSGILLSHFQMGVGDYVPEEWQQYIQATCASGLVLEFEQEAEDRIYALVVAAISQMDYVNIYGIDISQRKMVEDALRASENRYRNLFESAPIGIFEIFLKDKGDGKSFTVLIENINRKVEEVYGWTLNEVRSLQWNQVFSDDEIQELEESVNGYLAGESAFHIETIHTRKDKERFPVRIGINSLYELDRSKLILTIEDITFEKQRRSEEEAINAERQRLARDIHDGIAQNLAALHYQIDLLDELVSSDPERLRVELQALDQKVLENIRDVRRSIFALRPISLEDNGFFGALKQFVTGFRELHSLNVKLIVSGPQDRMPFRYETILFRIIQESLANIGKHAGAKNVSVKLDLQSDHKISLEIKDDGIGFDIVQQETAFLSGHFGLTQLKERIRDVDGLFEISSEEGKGTSISVTLPLSGYQVE